MRACSAVQDGDLCVSRVFSRYVMIVLRMGFDGTAPIIPKHLFHFFGCAALNADLGIAPRGFNWMTVDVFISYIHAAHPGCFSVDDDHFSMVSVLCWPSPDLMRLTAFFNQWPKEADTGMQAAKGIT